MYRAVLAGLEGHVYTHLASSLAQRRYTAGVATALPIMLPGTIVARRELHQTHVPLQIRDFIRGAFFLLPSAVISQILARIIPR